MSIYKKVPRKLKTWTDERLGNFAIMFEDDTEVRLHAPNGAYLYSIYFHPEYGLLEFTDLRWR